MLDIFVANMQHAIRNAETVTIGGGTFTPADLAKCLQEIEEKSEPPRFTSGSNPL